MTDLAGKIRNFLTKLQSLPEYKKKIILWVIVAILAVVMGFFWVREVVDNFSKIGESVKSINLPKVNINMPSLDILQTTTPSNK
jgi:polyferredoxin